MFLLVYQSPISCQTASLPNYLPFYPLAQSSLLSIYLRTYIPIYRGLPALPSINTYLLAHVRIYLQVAIKHTKDKKKSAAVCRPTPSPTPSGENFVPIASDQRCLDLSHPAPGPITGPQDCYVYCSLSQGAQYFSYQASSDSCYCNGQTCDLVYDQGFVVYQVVIPATTAPTAQPTTTPTSMPSAQPSQLPTSMPSQLPTAQPSQHPSAQPSKVPTMMPSRLPTNQPTQAPTANTYSYSSPGTFTHTAPQGFTSAQYLLVGGGGR